MLSGCDNGVGNGQEAVVSHKLLKPGGKKRIDKVVGGSAGTGASWIVGVAEAAGLGGNSTGDDPEVVDDAAASTSEAPIALNENPKVGGSG